MSTKKKVTFISRSDLRGGAAIVSYRLVEALRGIGVDAKMLVCEKLSDSDFVQSCALAWRIQYSFLKERLKVYLHNGFNRKDLFKVDPASDGLPLWKHPWVKDADAVLIGWVNQGMLSLQGINKICQLGKPVVWIMHDMWNLTGICHHAGDCRRYMSECGNCPLLGNRRCDKDLSHCTWTEKEKLYNEEHPRFVAVSTWLAEKAHQSGLMKRIPVAVIPNPFKLEMDASKRREAWEDEKVGLLFGAARIDDPIKGLGIFKRALEILVSDHPEVAEHLKVVTFGGCKEVESLKGFVVEHKHLGFLKDQEEVRKAYESCSIVVSTSDFETLPGTLVEGQAYGCIPVAMDHGGQRDIIDHKKTGWLAAWDKSAEVRSASIAEGIFWAYQNLNSDEIQQDMRKSVEEKFNAPEVAQRILDFTFQ